MELNEYKNLPKIITGIPGPKSKLLLQKQKRYETQSVVYPDAFPIAIKSADGSVIEDVDGNRFIDWVAGISVLNLGYGNIVRDAVTKQIENIWHALEIPTETRINFLEELNDSFPAAMRNYKTLFGISGADACEAAINIAHAVHSGNGSTIAFEGAYHGIAGGIISATAGEKYKRSSYSKGFNILRVPYPYSMWYPYSVNDIIDMIRKVMTDPEAGYNKPDSIIVEPIQGEGGYIVPPQGFLKAIREICNEFNLTMIVDEVQTGLGRTGKMWAFEHENIIPDIVCVSKSIGGGIPVSLVYYRDDYDLQLPKSFHIGTYRANPLALAAGVEILKTLPNYLERVRRDGEELKRNFKSINSDLIADVRGLGFMIGIELTEDNKPVSANKMVELKHSLLSKGLIMHTCGHWGNVFRYIGALNIPDELNQKGLEIFTTTIMEGVK